jgi:hypothetical protein
LSTSDLDGVDDAESLKVLAQEADHSIEISHCRRLVI